MSNKIIDLRSDTLTQPTQSMLEAMWSAKVGDNVYEEDETVIALETKAAKIFGKEAGLFCASGTMTNQIAIRVQTEANDEVICDRLAHIYNYEGGGIASNAAASVRLLEGDRGRISAAQVTENINPDDVHFPVTKLVALENTVNKAGGSIYPLEQIRALHQVCKNKGLRLHLDGARIFNALVASGDKPEDHGPLFDSISVCLSKGLGCPVGSLLLGNFALIKKAKRIRKVMGGGWRQAGYLAAAGIYALDNHIERLKEDHERAQQIAHLLAGLPFVKSIYPVETNIVIFELEDPIPAESWVNQLKQKNILVSTMGKNLIRFVTHLDFSDDDNDQLHRVLKNL